MSHGGISKIAMALLAIVCPSQVIGNPVAVSSPLSLNTTPALQASRGGPVLECCNCLNETKSVNVSTGVASWTVLGTGANWAGPASNSNPIDIQLGIAPLGANAAWSLTAIPSAKWITPPASALGIDFIYQTVIDTRACTIGSTIVVSGRVLADNAAAVIVNGVQVAGTAGYVAGGPGGSLYGFAVQNMVNFSYSIPAGGLHTITIRTRNGDQVTGMIADVTLTRTCRNSAEISATAPPPPAKP